ncbi:MAG: hypothetical protein ACRCWR_04965 [Saezia sp.]
MMSLKTLIQAALGECDTHTMERTTGDKNSAHYPLKKVNNVHIEKQIVNAIQEYCELSKLHSDVQALIDECLRQPTSAQIELLEHFREQVVAWRSVYHQLGIH